MTGDRDLSSMTGVRDLSSALFSGQAERPRAADRLTDHAQRTVRPQVDHKSTIGRPQVELRVVKVVSVSYN